jgi:hypothetical protein
MVQASLPSRRRLAEGGAPHHTPTVPLTAAGLEKIGLFGT